MPDLLVEARRIVNTVIGGWHGRRRRGAGENFWQFRPYVDGDAMALALRWAQEHGGQIIDPHSAVGLAAARSLDIDADIPVVTLATAHPAKFRDAVERATGVRPSLPARLGNLFEREERYVTLPGDYDAVKAHILAEAARG